MALKITGVRAIATAPEGVDLLAVKVETSEPGLYGVGCATFTQRNLAVKTVVEGYLAPLLKGKDPAAIEDIWRTVAGSAYWRTGPVLNNALSGVDMALWDIKAKQAGMPLYQLLGGRCREKVTGYIHVRGRSVEEVLEKARLRQSQGWRYLRCHNDEFLQEDRNAGVRFDPEDYMEAQLRLFEALRQELGPRVGLLHDIHERLAPDQAVRFAREMERFRLFFLEDALPPEELEWFHLLRSKTALPLAVGELFNSPLQWNGLIQNRLIDFIRVHLSQIGGITPARKLAALCEAFGVRTAWHGPGDITPIGHAANLHLDLCVPNFGIQEWLDDLGPASREVFPGAPYSKDGCLYLNESPGIGVDIDEEAAARYPCANKLPGWTDTRLPDGTPVYP